MFYLEKVPAKLFKLLVSYIDDIQGESKSRIINEAKGYLETVDKIPMDILESSLIKESHSP